MASDPTLSLLSSINDVHIKNEYRDNIISIGVMLKKNRCLASPKQNLMQDHVLMQLSRSNTQATVIDP